MDFQKSNWKIRFWDFVKQSPFKTWDFLSGLNLTSLFRFLISNSINILVIGISFGLVYFMPQGHVLPIDFFENDISTKLLNISLFYYLLFFLSLLVSHYPIYIFTALFDPKKYLWEMSNFGIITFYPKSNENTNQLDSVQECENKEDFDSVLKINDFFRKAFILLLFGYLNFILLQILKVNHTGYATTFEYVYIPLLFINVLFSSYLYFNASKTSIISIASKLMRFLLFTNLILFISLFYFGWGKYSVFIQLFFNQLLALQIFIYRTFRKTLNISVLNWTISDINFLRLLRGLGSICIIFIIGINVSTTLAEKVNPINIILLNLITLYTLIIIPIKLGMYLSHCNRDGKINTVDFKLFSFSYKAFYNILFLIFFLFIISFSSYNARIHTLSLVKSKDSERIQLPTFYDAIVANHNSDSTFTPIFYAAYGGGLMANYWNSLIINELDSKGYMNKIIAMSGVSGGGIGIANFTASKYQKTNDPNYQYNTSLNKIKSSNILGLELSWLFGLDLIREYTPLSRFGKDRSHRVMTYYANQIGVPELVDSVSFNKTYSKLFKHYGYFPNIIFNSTSTQDKYGVVSAIYQDTMLSKKKFIPTFPSADNLLDYREKYQDSSLTFYEAVSTCNRFPFISPAANVPFKGQYMDGGYFENSGIMSILSFRQALIKHEEDTTNKINSSNAIFKNKKSILITVRNNKNHYLRTLIRSTLSDKELTLEKPNIYTEIGSIFKGGINLERMPRYIKRTIETNYNEEFQVYNIDLPYYLTEKDVFETLGGIPNPKDLTSIMERIKKSNFVIDSLLRATPEYKLDDWGVVNPPTARLLSKPVEIYMKAMLNHPNIRLQLDSLKNKVK